MDHVPARNEAEGEGGVTERILLVDDDSDFVRLLSRTLQRSGRSIVSYASGAEALAVLRQECFELIALDLFLPDTDGWKLLERLRAMPHQSGCRVLMISAQRSSSAEVRRALQAGANDFLAKSMDPEELSLRVEGLLRTARLETGLRAAEQRYRALFENTQDAILLADDTARFMDVNPAACRLLDRDATASRNLTLWDVTPIGSHEVGRRKWRDFLAGGQMFGEHQLIRADGSIIEVEYRAVANVRPGLHMASLREITRRKAAEQQLRASEEKFHSIVEDQAEFIVRWRPDGRRTFVNGSYCRYFNTTPEEAGRTSFFDLISAEDRQAVLGRIGRLTPAVPVASGEHRVIRADGSEGWNAWTDRAFFNEAGEPVELQSVGRDITAEKQAEDQLIRLKTHLESAQRIGGIGSWEWNVKTGDTFWSTELYRIYGRAVSSGIPDLDTYLEEIHPDDREALVRAIESSLKTGRYVSDYRLLRGGSHDVRWIHAEGEVIFDEAGNPELHRGFAQDVTRRRQAEEELKTHARRLSELTMKVESIREEERKAISREIHDGLGQLVAGLQMDLARTVRRLQEVPDVAKRSALEESLASAGEVCARIYDGMRSIVRRLRPSALDELGLTAAIRGECREFGRHSGLHFEFTCREEMAGLSDAAATVLFRVAQELMTNAARHSQGSSCRVSLAREADMVLMEVVDDGVGMDPVDWATGAGFGLLGIRERLTALGGALAIMPSLQQGARFEVRLPVAGNEEGEEKRKTPAKKATGMQP